MPRADRQQPTTSQPQAITGKGNGKSFSPAGKKQYNYKVKKANGKNSTGAPSKYDEQFVPLVYELARHGATYADIAQAFNVGESTVKLWRRDDDEFLAAYKKGKDEFDSGKVESALLKRALGYEYEETTVKRTTITLGRGKDKFQAPAEEITVAKKKMAPDIGAAIFWLTNRQRERWQNTRYVQHAGKVEGPAAVVNNHYDFSEVGKEELETLRDSLNKAIVQRSRDDKTDGKAGQPTGTA